MGAFIYGVALQCRMDMRSKSLLLTCYIVPLIFFLLTGGIFTAVMPEMRGTLIQSIVVMGVSMGALIGVPPSLSEIYGGGITKVYRANGVPLYTGVLTMAISAFVHLVLMCVIIILLAPVAFGAERPENPAEFMAALGVYIAVSLGIGCVLGLAVGNQSKQTMVAQIVFLPSIMLTGIMFPSELLPDFLQAVGELLPARWGYRLMLEGGLVLENLWYPLVVLLTSGLTCSILLKKPNMKL